MPRKRQQPRKTSKATPKSKTTTVAKRRKAERTPPDELRCKTLQPCAKRLLMMVLCGDSNSTIPGTWKLLVKAAEKMLGGGGQLLMDNFFMDSKILTALAAVGSGSGNAKYRYDEGEADREISRARQLDINYDNLDIEPSAMMSAYVYRCCLALVLRHPDAAAWFIDELVLRMPKRGLVDIIVNKKVLQRSLVDAFRVLVEYIMQCYRDGDLQRAQAGLSDAELLACIDRKVSALEQLTGGIQQEASFEADSERSSGSGVTEHEQPRDLSHGPQQRCATESPSREPLLVGPLQWCAMAGSSGSGDCSDPEKAVLRQENAHLRRQLFDQQQRATELQAEASVRAEYGAPRLVAKDLLWPSHAHFYE